MKLKQQSILYCQSHNLVEACANAQCRVSLSSVKLHRDGARGAISVRKVSADIFSQTHRPYFIFSQNPISLQFVYFAAFGRAVYCLSKIGEDIYFEGESNGVSVFKRMGP